MDSVWVGVIGSVVLLVCLGLGVPVFICMLLPGILGLVYLIGITAGFELAISQVFNFATRFEFTAVPMFLLMGYLAMESGLTSSAYNCARLWLSRLPGGLGMATCTASALFGACCGSGISAVAAMSRIAVPEMIRFNYDKRLAIGTVTAASTVAVLIPPSVIMVIYAIFSEASLGRLLLAGYLPGILSMVIYMAMICIRVRLNPKLAPSIPGEVITWRQRVVALKDLWGVSLLAVVLMGGIYTGFFTATEAAAACAFLAFVIIIIVGKLMRSVVRHAFAEALRISAMSYGLIMGAAVFAIFVNRAGLTQKLTAFFVGAQMSPTLFVILCCLLFGFLGCFIPSMAIMLITMPILLPILVDLDINLIWFGIIYVKMVEIGAITPPFGLVVYVIKGVLGADVAIQDIFQGIWWFLMMDILTLVIIIAFPQICLWLPNTMLGG